MTLKLRILLAISASVFIALFANSWLTIYLSSKDMSSALLSEAQNKLIATRELVKARVEGYFSTIEGQVIAKAADVSTVEAAVAFSNAFFQFSSQRGLVTEQAWPALEGYYRNEFGAEYTNQNSDSADIQYMLDGLSETTVLLQHDFIAANTHPLGNKDKLYRLDSTTEYARVHTRYHETFRTFLQTFGYYDVFLVEPEEGHIIYSVYKELDFATSLRSGPYANTGIGEAFKQALSLSKGQYYLTDFDKYLPSYNNPASFISSPVFQGDNLVGVLIFQMPINALNTIMTQSENWKERGFGNSGEIYLVGRDKTLRNESRFLVEDKPGYLAALRKVGIRSVEDIDVKNTSISLQPVDTKGVTEALAGRSGFDIFNDYREVPVLSAYAPVKVGQFTWAIMSEIDEEEAFEPANSLIGKIATSSVLVTAVLVLASLGGAILLTNYLIKPLAGLAKQFSELNSSDADLTTRVSASRIPEIDLVSNGFNAFVEQVQKIISAVKVSTELIARSSAKLSKVTENTSSASEKQKNEAENVTESISQFNLALREVSENSVAAAVNTNECRQQANANADRAKSAARNITELVHEVTHSAETLQQLRSEVANIDDVLNVINGIADQTNLLALNAAIEAARAGEHGRGFAVVADEVRQLASRTQESTVEIQGKIAQLTTVAEEAVASMQRASSAADGGIEQVGSVSDTLVALSASIDELAVINDTVASATEQQKATCDAINDNINYVKDASLELSQASEQIDAAAVGLSEIAGGMEEQVARFTV